MFIWTSLIKNYIIYIIFFLKEYIIYYRDFESLEHEIRGSLNSLVISKFILTFQAQISNTIFLISKFSILKFNVLCCSAYNALNNVKLLLLK